MIIPCDKAIRCPGVTSQGYDYPVANFSSERPDENIIPVINYDGDPPPLDGNPNTFVTKGCVSWCISNTSQLEADLCAAAQAVLCIPDTPGGGGGGGGGGAGPTPSTKASPGPGRGPGPVPGTNPKKYGNNAQTCSVTCPNGQVFTATIDAGKVVSNSQAKADAIVHSLACKEAQKKVICIVTFNGFACADPLFSDLEYEFTFTAITSAPPLTWSISGGSLPPGIVLETTGELHGFPYQPGFYNFVVQATDANGNTTNTANTFQVFGITNPNLPNGTVGVAYSEQILTGGGTAPVTFALSVGSSLPVGLTLSSSGMISGTPTVVTP